MVASLLSWALQNKVATAALGAGLILLVALGVTQGRLTLCQYQLQTAQAQERAARTIIESYKSLSAGRQDRLDRAEEKYADLKKKHDKLLRGKTSPPVPQDCKGAVEWAASESSKLFLDW